MHIFWRLTIKQAHITINKLIFVKAISHLILRVRGIVIVICDSSHHTFFLNSWECFFLQDYNLKDSLQYEKPIQVVRPFSQLQPPKQPNNFVPELFKVSGTGLHSLYRFNYKFALCFCCTVLLYTAWLRFTIRTRYR